MGRRAAARVLLAAVSSMRVHAAWAALGTVTANKLKRDIVLNVARIMLARAEDVAKIEKILARMARAARNRNYLVHASYGLSFSRRFKLRVLSLDAQEDPAIVHYQEFSESDLLNIKT